ncbi:GNAT family N-acetyltransferase [Micromonospora sp. WMMD734]|uniref:GNAT family N-acetyltransferase n=1 Tax=unclassified Micromonospora TaxID=2617518 RepID=UPI00249C9411|nr:GNAT family N-acetyltransferase [Micromonospora sp. WMMD712]WFE59511.1 GNAT family N-acetyltransferase [Micromonospora sp. WMMD712]
MTVEVVDSPAAVPGWDAALGDRDTFYASRDWLTFSDSDGEARARYAVAGNTQAPQGMLPVHLARTETNGRYRPGREVRTLADCPHRLAVLGGRRGYRSVPPPPAETLPALRETAVAAQGEPVDGWWWPYLLSEEVHAVIKAPGDQRPAVSLLNADCVLDVPGDGFDDYLAALPNKRRRYNVRQEARAFAASGLTVRRLRLSECWEQGGVLASNLQRRYGHDHSPALMADVLRRQAERLDHRSVVFGCYDGARMVGFSLAYRWRSELVIRLVGFDYDRLRDAYEYPQLVFYSPLEFCYEEGLTGIQLGTSSLGAKALRGARVRPLWSLTHCPCLTGPAGPADVLNRRLDTLTGQLPDSEAHRFAETLRPIAEAFATTPPTQASPEGQEP